MGIQFREFAIQLSLPESSLKSSHESQKIPVVQRRCSLRHFVPSVSRFALAEVPKTFEWKGNDLVFAFEVTAGKPRQKRMVPVGASPSTPGDSSGAEVALQCSGENSPDQGMKSGNAATRGPACFCRRGRYWLTYVRGSSAGRMAT